MEDRLDNCRRLPGDSAIGWPAALPGNREARRWGLAAWRSGAEVPIAVTAGTQQPVSHPGVGGRQSGHHQVVDGSQRLAKLAGRQFVPSVDAATRAIRPRPIIRGFAVRG